MTIYIAKAPIVKVDVGPSSGNRVARFIREGEVIPEGVEQEQLDRLAQLDMIEPQPDADEAETEAKEKSLDDFTKAELEAEIEKRNEGREDDVKVVPAGPNKPELLAALKADDERLAAQQ